MTREPISKDVLIVNRALKSQIDQFRQKEGFADVCLKSNYNPNASILTFLKGCCCSTSTGCSQQ